MIIVKIQRMNQKNFIKLLIVPVQWSMKIKKFYFRETKGIAKYSFRINWLKQILPHRKAGELDIENQSPNVNLLKNWPSARKLLSREEKYKLLGRLQQKKKRKQQEKKDQRKLWWKTNLNLKKSFRYFLLGDILTFYVWKIKGLFGYLSQSLS